MGALVFAYGTLKDGFPNFRINNGNRVPGEFMTVQRFPLYLVGARRTPWLVNSPGEGEQVLGQVFEVDDAALLQMDRLERVHAPDGYQRLSIEVGGRGKPGVVPFAVFAYVKEPEQLAEEKVWSGPLAEYTLEHATLYMAPRDA
jgi:gamma-glutamylaminecyclotransferase